MSVVTKLPKFYYATGTTWAFNFAGLTVSMTGEVALSTIFTKPKF
jgi:hypothetical protein